MHASHRAILGYSLSEHGATSCSSLAIIPPEASSAEGMNKRIRATTMRLRLEGRPRTAGSGRDPGPRGVDDNFFDLFSQDISSMRHKEAPSPLREAASVVCGPIDDDVLGERNCLLRVQDAGGSSSACGDTDREADRDEMRKSTWGAIRRARSAILSKNQKVRFYLHAIPPETLPPIEEDVPWL